MPTLLLRDHRSGYTRLLRLNDKTIISYIVVECKRQFRAGKEGIAYAYDQRSRQRWREVYLSSVHHAQWGYLLGKVLWAESVSHPSR
nr:MAG TPA: hypothetical protein [Caudoviricetes sp.]